MCVDGIACSCRERNKSSFLIIVCLLTRYEYDSCRNCCLWCSANAGGSENGNEGAYGVSREYIYLDSVVTCPYPFEGREVHG